MRSMCLTPDRLSQHCVPRVLAPEHVLTWVAIYDRSSSARRGRFSERSCRQRIARTLAKMCSAVRAMKIPQIPPGMPTCTHSTSARFLRWCGPGSSCVLVQSVLSQVASGHLSCTAARPCPAACPRASSLSPAQSTLLRHLHAVSHVLTAQASARMLPTHYAPHSKSLHHAGS